MEEALQRRAAAGIVKGRGWRMFSLPCKNLIVEEITTISDENEDGGDRERRTAPETGLMVGSTFKGFFGNIRRNNNDIKETWRRLV